MKLQPYKKNTCVVIECETPGHFIWPRHCASYWHALMNFDVDASIDRNEPIAREIKARAYFVARNETKRARNKIVSREATTEPKASGFYEWARKENKLKN